ncbi:MAG: hypothetical protein ACO3UU_13920 [Minisyncoccia bacterium]
MLFETRMERSHIENRLRQLPRKTYNQFVWWRRYQQRQTLDDKMPLYNKLINGDYETSDYYYQAEHENYLLEDTIKDIKHYEEKLEKIGLFRARYKKLHEDFLKEEEEILRKMKKDFIRELKITKDELEAIMETFDGTVLEMYEYIKQNKGEYFADRKPVPKLPVLECV